MISPPELSFPFPNIFTQVSSRVFSVGFGVSVFTGVEVDELLGAFSLFVHPAPSTSIKRNPPKIRKLYFEVIPDPILLRIRKEQRDYIIQKKYRDFTGYPNVEQLDLQTELLNP
jgi:hypothetical protein